MAYKFIPIIDAKVGSIILIDGISCDVRSTDVSKTGKHGSMKCRLEVATLIDNKKKVQIFPSSDKIEVPIIEKKEAQVLSIKDDVANVMDPETYETFDVKISEDFKDQVKEGLQVNYWIIMGQKIIRQVK